MIRITIQAVQYYFQRIGRYNIISSILLTAFISMLLGAAVQADAKTPAENKMSLERIAPRDKNGYGYKLQYYLFAPIDVAWRFKTDFGSDLLLTSDELIGHRLVKTVGNSVITENRYATAPGLKFLWETVVIEEQYRMEFELLNAKESRHDFHFGSIQLSPAGDYTKVTQIAYFDFTGASIWVKYPWYGGMKHTLTEMVEWEQKTVRRYRKNLKLVKDTRKNDVDLNSVQHFGPSR